jgi:hypothetical protein
MTEMDALRLRLAARAYRATRLTDDQVEDGVRRTLAAMRRSRARRRTALTPAIVIAILAFGTLAYAKPENLRRWMQSLWLSSRESVSQQVAAQLRVMNTPRAAAPASEKSAAEEALAAAPEPQASDAPEAVSPPASEDGATQVQELAPAAERTARATHDSPRLSAKAPAQQDKPEHRATWAEVNTALAQKDTAGALAALADLSRHGDPGTRAKAQLGVAQLLWSRGDRATACNIARALVEASGTPGRVKERAGALREGCER